MSYNEKFFTAVIKNDYDAVAKFLSSSFLKLIKSTDINARDKMGNTPLILAIEKGHKEIAKLLIDGGADLNVTNNGSSALILAFEKEMPEIVKMLIAKGVDINVKNNNGDTPLIFGSAKNGSITHRQRIIKKAGETKRETEI